MKIDAEGRRVTVSLDASEIRLLRRALERASFIDTPAKEQPEIAVFCQKLLEVLREPSESGKGSAVVHVLGE